MSNPHLREMEQRALESGLEMGISDLESADEHAEPIECAECGEPAYWKPTVGTYVCLAGHVKR